MCTWYTQYDKSKIIDIDWILGRCVDKILMCADDIKYYDKHKCLAYVFGAEALFIQLRKIAFALNAIKFACRRRHLDRRDKHIYLLRARVKKKKKEGRPRNSSVGTISV